MTDRWQVLPEWAAAQATVVHIARNHRADDQTTVTPEGMRHLNAALAALCEAVAREERETINFGGGVTVGRGDQVQREMATFGDYTGVLDDGVKEQAP